MGVFFFFFFPSHVRVSLLYLISMRNTVVEQEHKGEISKSPRDIQSQRPSKLLFLVYMVRYAKSCPPPFPLGNA